MIINHEDALRCSLFKGTSIKTWAPRDSKATRGNLMQITQYQQKTTKLCLGIFTATPSSSQAKQLKALYHQLPFPSTFGRSLWLLASQLAPMMTLFILQATLCLKPQLFYHNFVWQTVCAFHTVCMVVLPRGHEPHRIMTAMYQTWWEYTRKLKHGNNSNSLTSVKMTLSSAKTTSH